MKLLCAHFIMLYETLLTKNNFNDNNIILHT